MYSTFFRWEEAPSMVLTIRKFVSNLKDKKGA